MEELPIEVLANHLFKYFSFPEWLRTLVPVCKLWQQAAISSNASKQVVVDLETSATNRHYCIQTISKYKIDTIIVSDLGTSINFFERLLAASPKLNTIAFVGSNYDHEALTPAHSLEEMFEHTPKRTFSHITTLSVNAYHFALLPLFPNVSRLRIEEFISDEEILEKDRTKILSFPKIRELEITQQSFGGWESIQLQFPNLEILYIAILDYAKNAEIIAKGKELGIKVFCESTHLVKTSWNLPNVSYHLYAFEHRKTPLAYPVTIANAECSLEKLQEIMARTSPAYEKELATRIAEFNFPMRTRAYGTDPVSLGTFPNIRKPEFIKPLYENKFLEFWTAFQNAVNVDQTELSIELSKELVNNIDADTTNKVPKLSVVLKFIEKITDTQLFLDAVGSDAVKKIMSVTDKQGHNVIALWAMSNSRDINWKPIDEYIDWNTKVNHGSKTEPKYGNLATAAFTEQRFDKWKFLMNEKKQEVDLELVTDDQFKGFIRRDDLDDMALLAVNKEITSRIVFEASLLMGEDEDLDSYKALIAKFGSEYLTQCYKGTYLLQYLVGRARRHRSMFFPYLVNEHKLDINYIDENGKTPLTALIPKLQETEDVNVVQTLLNLGADPNLTGDTLLPLFLAMELTIGETNQVVETLIDAGANVNAVDFDKNGRRATPLSMAVSKGVPKEIVESLIMHGADTKFVDDAGNTLIHTLLLAEGLDDIIQLLPILVKHVDINQPNLLGETPLHRALLSGYDTSLISKLVECGADVNQCGGPPLQPPLVMALNYFPTIKALLKSEKLDIKAKNRVGESTFYILVRLNFTTGDFDDVNTLLSDNEFLEVAVKYGTPENIEFIVSEVKRAINDHPGGLRNLFTLCIREMTLLKFLIENVGLDVNTKTAIGKTLLSSIVISMKNSYEVAEYLIQKGADVNVQDNYGDTPLMIAVRLTSVSREQYRYRQLLMKHGASVTLKNNLGIAPIDIDPMIETRYLEEERSMAYYDDRTAADLLTPSLAELRKKAKQNATDATDPGKK